MKHYDHTHTTVAEARACEAQRQAAPAPVITRDSVNARLRRSLGIPTPTPTRAIPQPAAASTAPERPGWVERPAHPNRVTFARKLMAEKPRCEEYVTIDCVEVMMHLHEDKPVSADEIDKLIKQLLDAPRYTP